MTFDENGRTFTGCSVEAFALTASAYCDFIGINCSLGPDKIFPLLPSAGDCPGGAGLFAESAADAFWVVGIFHRIAVHLAGPGAGPAAYAFVRVCPVPEDRDGVKH